MRRIGRIACIAAAVIAGLAPLFGWAQTGTATGAIQGAVVDSTGAAIAEVRVIARQEGYGVARVARTDAAGQFQFSALAIGRYTLRFEKEGFAPVEVQPFLVSVGQTVVHRGEMKLAQVIEKVEVKEQPEALDAASTAPSVALGYARIEEAPAQNRNYLNFVLVAPGVAASSGSNSQRSLAGARSALSDSGFTFAGMRGRNNSISIDGVDNRDETTGGNRVAIGLEMVQEFRVSGTSVGAEFGGAAGGLVNMVTRSGTNLWHGDFTFFTQNEMFNARDPEVASGPKQRFRRYQPGASINGPIRKDRTFFSTAIETEWEFDQEWSDAPGEALEAIHRALGSRQFSGAAVRSGFRGLFDDESRETEFSFKLNHQAGTRDSFTARYAFSRGRVSGGVQGADNFSDRSSRGNSLTRDHSLVAGWMRLPAPHLVNDLRVQVARRNIDLEPSTRGAMLEIPGVLTLGQSYRLDAARGEDHYELVESMNLAAGRHQMSLGASVHLVRLDARLANRFGGVFLFPTLTDFLRGAPDVFLQAFGISQTNLTTVPLALWAQDRWQLRPGLTLEAGLRFDRQRMPSGLPSSSNNAAPRVGLAWRPRGTASFVVRAGFGWFYDRYPLAFLNDALQKDGRRGFEQYLTGEAASRAFALARGGTLAAPIPGVPPAVYRADANFPATHSRKLTAGIEKSLGRNTTLTVEYANVRGFHLPRMRNITGLPAAVYQLEQTAKSAYQGASVSVNRRVSRELSFLVAYNGGRTWDDASDFDEHPLDPRNIRLDWARSRQHQAHRLAASTLFDLPVEHLPQIPEWLRESLEHLTVAPILTLGSGRPLNALDSTDTFRTGAFPLSARPFGLPRNPFFAASPASLDLRLMKTFPFHNDRSRLQIGVEAFNLLNHTNVLRVSPYFAAAGQRLASYARPIETLNARQIQLLAQFEY